MTPHPAGREDCHRPPSRRDARRQEHHHQRAVRGALRSRRRGRVHQRHRVALPQSVVPAPVHDDHTAPARRRGGRDGRGQCLTGAGGGVIRALGAGGGCGCCGLVTTSSGRRRGRCGGNLLRAEAVFAEAILVGLGQAQGWDDERRGGHALKIIDSPPRPWGASTPTPPTTTVVRPMVGSCPTNPETPAATRLASTALASWSG